MATKFVPRDFSLNSREFGHSEALGWRSLAEIVALEPDLASTPDRAAALLRAAQLQHLYARRIRRRLRESKISVRDLAGAAGVKYDRMVKVLRGSAVLRLEDIAAGDFLVGQVSEFAISDAQYAAREAAAALERDRQAELEWRKGIKETLARVSGPSVRGLTGE